MHQSIQFESFEPRRLLSAALEGSTLHVAGTSHGDHISVELDRIDPSRLDVKVNHTHTSFQASKVKLIRIDGRRGSDDIEIDQRNGAIHTPTLIFGGAGDDSIVGGAGRDRIHGEEGDDSILGQSSRDIIYGEAGDDSLNGGAGDDDLIGGAGADHSHGGRGDDDFKDDDTHDVNDDRNATDTRDHDGADDLLPDDHGHRRGHDG